MAYSASRAKKHIRGVRLHFIPESENGSPELYQGITFEKVRNYIEDKGHTKGFTQMHHNAKQQKFALIIWYIAK